MLWIWTMVVGILIHGLMLGADYAALPNLYRADTEAQNYFGWMVLGHLSMAIGITWVYRMGKEDKPWLPQGIRFGIALILLMTTSIYLIYYAVQPMPGTLVGRQVGFDSIAIILTGIITAFVNR